MGLFGNDTSDLERRLERVERLLAVIADRLDIPLDGNGPSVTLTAGGPSSIVHDLVRRGQLIEAIKHYREETGVGLKEAKDYVDSLKAQMGR